MTTELVENRDTFVLKLLLKLCQTNDISTFLRIPEQVLTYTDLSRTVYDRVQHRYRHDRALPSPETLMELGFAFNLESLTGTTAHYLEETFRAFRLHFVSRTLSSLITDLSSGNTDTLVAKVSEVQNYIALSSGQYHLQARALEELSEQIIQEALTSFCQGGAGVITTGYRELDTLMAGGYYPQNLYVWVGRQKQGKTTYMIHQAIQAWRSGSRVLMLSGEMGLKEMALKVITEETGLSMYNILQGQITNHGEEMIRAVTVGHEERFFFQPTPYGSTLKDLEGLIQELRPDIVYVDSAHLLEAQEYGRYKPQLHERIRETVNCLKQIAIVQNIPIVATTHLSREGESTRTRAVARRQRSIEYPDLRAIAGSDEWAKTASVIFAVVNAPETTQRIFHMMVARTHECKNYLVNFNFEGRGNFQIIREFTDADIDNHNRATNQGANNDEENTGGGTRRRPAPSLQNSLEWLVE